MSNYAAKSDGEKVTGVDTSDFTGKADSVSLKTEVEKLGIDKLKTVSNDLNNL